VFAGLETIINQSIPDTLIILFVLRTYLQLQQFDAVSTNNETARHDLAEKVELKSNKQKQNKPNIHHPHDIS
jgi:hypothetical protein